MDAQDFADVLSAVRAFVREQVIPREEEIEDTDAIPEPIRAAAREMGLFGYALPEEYGGLGLSMSEEVRLVFEIGYASPAFRSMFGTSNGIAGQVLVHAGPRSRRPGGCRSWPPARSWARSRSPRPRRARTPAPSPPPRAATATTTC